MASGLKKNRDLKSRYHYIIPGTALVSGFVALAMFLWIGIVIQRQKISFLYTDAAMNMRIEVANFHFAFEKALYGPADEKGPDLFINIDNALNICHSLLHGGELGPGETLPQLKDHELREIVAKAASHLTRLKEIAQTRLQQAEMEKTRAPSSDEGWHAALNGVMEISQSFEFIVEKRHIINLADLRRLLFELVMIWASVVLILSVCLYHLELRRKKSETLLKKAHDEMDQKVQDRTMELSRINRQLEKKIAEHQQTEKNLEESRQKLRSLMVNLQSVQEEEKILLSREIHDQLGQVLTGLSMELVWVERRISNEYKLYSSTLSDTMNSMASSIDGAIRQVRNISTELRPGVLDIAGLVAAIKWQSDRFQEKTGVDCMLLLPYEKFNLDTHRSTAIFRIFQEILTNVARHSNATQVSINLIKNPEMLVLEVEDNGKGITNTEISGATAFGIMGMSERADALGGEFHIEGALGKGTRVVVTIPLSTGTGPQGEENA
jgi:signal transduction histidine kinase